MVPDLLDLTNCDIEEHAPSFNRLILKITTTNVCRIDISGGYNNNYNNFNNNIVSASKPPGYSEAPGSSSWCLYNSLSSLNSGYGGGEREQILFIGFEESWERDMWSAWLTQVIKLSDIAGYGSSNIYAAGGSSL